MHTITIDAERCKGDGACAQICPTRIFRLTRRKEPPKLEGLDRCVLCGQCLAVCPNEAIVHSALDHDRLERIRDRRPVSGDGLIEALRQRRSVRVYKNEPVPRALLEKVVGVAGYAPTSAHGGEGWVRSVAVVTGARAMSRVRDLTVEYLRLMAILLAAQANGLGACWNGYLSKAASGFKTKSFTALREMLEIPPHHDVYAAATIGYPGMKLHSVPQRETSIRWIR